MLFSTRVRKYKHGCRLFVDASAFHVEAWVVEKFLWEPGGGHQAPDRLQVCVKTGILKKS